MKLKLITLALTLVCLAGTVAADDVNCPPDLGAVTIDGNVLVAGPCTLDGTTVKGNVYLYSGGSLIARNAIIDGNIQADNADYVDVTDTRVGGSIQLENLVGDVSNVERNTVTGDIQLVSNRSVIDVHDNFVGADIQAFSNTGGITITGNTVDGNLQCKSNDPAPTGSGNDVSGNAEDQCADLAASSGDSGAGSPGGDTGGYTASGDDVNCPPDLGVVTIDGNVIVTAACRLDGTTVNGNVLLYAGGSLTARNAAINGNVQAENADFVDITDSDIGGSIQLDHLVGDVSNMDRNLVDGNIQLDGNRSRLEVGRNYVNGDIQALGNTGGVVITDNTVNGNLQCKSNNPAPEGSGNQVSGNKEDQCQFAGRERLGRCGHVRRQRRHARWRRERRTGHLWRSGCFRTAGPRCLPAGHAARRGEKVPRPSQPPERRFMSRYQYCSDSLKDSTRIRSSLPWIRFSFGSSAMAETA